MITTTTTRLRDLLDMVETWEPRADSTVTEAWTVLQCAREFSDLADELIRSAVADVRTIPPHGAKVVPDDDGTNVTTQATTAADRATAQWSWAAIGRSLGVSAQAAQQRFSAPRT